MVFVTHGLCASMQYSSHHHDPHVFCKSGILTGPPLASRQIAPSKCPRLLVQVFLTLLYSPPLLYNMTHLQYMPVEEITKVHYTRFPRPGVRCAHIILLCFADSARTGSCLQFRKDMTSGVPQAAAPPAVLSDRRQPRAHPRSTFV